MIVAGMHSAICCPVTFSSSAALGPESPYLPRRLASSLAKGSSSSSLVGNGPSTLRVCGR